MRALMNWKSWRDYISPREESLDPGFREEIRRLSVTGLRIIAVVHFSVMFLGTLIEIGFPEFEDPQGDAVGYLTLIAAGTVFGLSFWPPAQAKARAIGFVFGYVVGSAMLAVTMRLPYDVSVDMVHAHMPMLVTLFVLVYMVAFPLKPIQTLGYGVAMLGSYLWLTAVLRTTEEITGMIAAHVLFELVIIFVCAGLTSAVYNQRIVGYRARRLVEESFEELKAAQAKLLLSRNTISQARLASALTHELNTPLGALASALDTIRRGVEKLLPPGSDGEGVAKPVADALRSAREAGGRLNRMLTRMKSLTNLDRAEEQTIDLNALWQDTAALLEPELAPKAEVRFELQTVPPTRARPEQISAVFSNLLRNAAAAMDSKGVIEVRTSSADEELVSEVRDTGAGMSEETLSQLFEPAFRVEGSRVSTSNWGLFVSRSIVVEHGGSIEVASELGQGTTVRVVLPVR